ncbi:MAG: hypothetical protein AAGE52_14465 [Myxococcota bacterium]
MRSALLVLLLVVGCGDDDSTGTGDGSVERDTGAADTGTADTGTAGAADTGAADTGAADTGAADTGTADTGAGSCDDGVRNGSETDIDCGGTCDACANFLACETSDDCQSGNCDDDVCSSPPGTHPDIVRVADVPGRNPGSGWFDSYSVGNACYCDSSFDHNIGPLMVDTPFGPRTVRQVCDALAAEDPPPRGDNPVYNDIQCGNGPPNDAGDEDDCPGRVDIGREGCGHIGPRWRLSDLDSI